MDVDIAKYYVTDAIIFAVAMYIILKKWDNNKSAKTVLIKLAFLIIALTVSTIPAVLDLKKAVTKNYMVVQGEVVSEKPRARSLYNILEVRSDSGKKIRVKINSVYPDKGDEITVKYLPITKYAKIEE